MSPCIFCHRRGVTEDSYGNPLCAACAQDAAEEERETFEIENTDECRFPRPCRCPECALIEAGGW